MLSEATKQQQKDPKQNRTQKTKLTQNGKQHQKESKGSGLDLSG